MFPTLAIFALKTLLATGFIGAAAAWLAKKLPAFNFNTGHARLDQALDLLGNACEGVIKSELTGPLLSDAITALMNGRSVLSALSADLPRLRNAVVGQLGPAVTQSLSELLGTDAGVKRIETGLLAAATDHTLKVIATLPSGAKVVKPA